LADFVIAHRNPKARTKFPQLFLVQFFLLVGDVLSFAGLAQAVSLDGACQNHRRPVLELRRRLVRRVHLARIVPRQPQAPQRIVRQRFHQLQQPGIAAKEKLPHIRTA